MGPGIVIPLLLLAVALPVVLSYARKRLKNPGSASVESAPPPSARLTSNALRSVPSPPWRIVYEIAPDKLGGVEHVLIGPPGVFAVQTALDPVPSTPAAPDPQAIARAAITRGALDDALRRCAMSSDRLLVVHWAPADTAGPESIESLPGVTDVDGRRLTEWCERQAQRFTPAQVDLAWQTVLTAIGRPDPLK